MGADTRGQVPRTDAVLADERLVAATRRPARWQPLLVRSAVAAQVRSHATGSPSTTQLPGSASRPMNRPVNGDRTS